MSNWIKFLSQLLELVMLAFTKFRKTPKEKRRKSLSRLEGAIKESKLKGNTKAVEAWFGERL